ncbi:MAG: hypothetical protein N2Z60_06700, partial [Elusimicrobiales bacterium]|nr:hypothetical protein [Elusimicrobiales bacterium]
AHDPHKGYLGLPHKFDRPAQDIRICENLNNYKRYASPILFHLEPINNAQGWKLNISIFPKNFLNQNQPNNREIRTNCEEFLSEFIKYIRQNINNNNLVIETYGNRNNRRNNNYRGRHP